MGGDGLAAGLAGAGDVGLVGSDGRGAADDSPAVFPLVGDKVFVGAVSRYKQ